MSEIVLGFDDSQVLLAAEELVDTCYGTDVDFTLTRFDFENGNTYLIDDEPNIAKEYLRFSSKYFLYDYGKLAVEHYGLTLLGNDTAEVEAHMADRLAAYKRCLEVASKISDSLLLQAFNELS